MIKILLKIKECQNMLKNKDTKIVHFYAFETFESFGILPCYKFTENSGKIAENSGSGSAK